MSSKLMVCNLFFACLIGLLTTQQKVLGCCDGPPVAFRASKVKPENVIGIVKFEKADLNRLGVYDYSTGKFTAPCSGTYVFTWTLVTKEKKVTASELVVNGKRVARAFSDARDARRHMDDSASNTVPVDMEEGEEAYIRINSHWGKFVDGSRWSSFSGWKLSG